MKIILRSVLLASVLFTAACKKDVRIEPKPVSILTGISAAPSFNWQTSREVSLSISITDGRFLDKLHVISIYLSDPADGGLPLSKGAASISRPFNTKISVPTTINEVYLVKTSPDGLATTSKVALTSNKIAVGISAASVPNKVSVVAIAPPAVEPACEVTVTGTAITLPANKMACYNATADGYLSITPGEGSTLKLNTNGNSVVITLSSHSQFKLIISAGSVVTVSGVLYFSTNESIVNNGTLTFNNRIEIGENCTITNNGEITHKDRLSSYAGTTIINNNIYNSPYVQYANLAGLFINRKKAVFNSINVIGRMENECDFTGLSVLVQGIVNNYASFKAPLQFQQTSPSTFNLYNGAVLYTGYNVYLFGKIQGHGTTSFMKGDPLVVPYSDPLLKIAGTIQYCGAGLLPENFTNGAIRGCDLYIPVTDCITVGNGTLPPDTDGDGIIDPLDDFPNDVKKAFISRSLNYTNGGSTVAFEDNWPAKGDYDLNDVVLNSKYLIATNSDNIVVQVVADFVLKASGADFHNGAGVQFHLPAASATLVSATGGAYLETQQDSVVVMLFNDSKTEQPTGNTNPAQAISPVKLYSITFDVTNGPALAAFGSNTFNPFICNNSSATGRSYETHMYGKFPTSRANPALFGTKDDRSGAGRFYTTDDNLPWAIELPIANFSYMKEGADISKGYLKFKEWANSSGAMFPDWYSNILYQNPTFIFGK
ncbi:MAG: LruC domain-containing protein [Bacteroidota bacterium]